MSRVFRIRIRILTTGISSLLLGIVLGCTTTVETTPDWITGVDGTHPRGRQIVAYGRDIDRDGALQIAQDDARRQVEQILIRALEAEGAVLTEASTRLIELVSARRSEALEELDTFTRVDQQNNYETYLLLLYREIDQATDLGQIRDEEMAVPEEEPIDATVETAFQGIRELLDRPVPVTPVRRSEVLREARILSGEVRVRVAPNQQTVRLGTAPSRSVEVEAYDLATDTPIRGESFVVEIRGPLVDGNRSTSRVDISTDEDGRFVFTIPEPTYAGTTRIGIEPQWFGSVFDRWEEAVSDGGNAELLRSIEARVRGVSLLEVTTRAPEIPTAVVVLDRDIAGNPMDDTNALTGALQEFAARGFRVRNVDLHDASRRLLTELEQINVADLYDIFPFEVLSTVDRAIVGNARMLTFEESDGIRVGVEIDVVAFDLRRDQQLARVTVVERITGSSAQATIRAAFQEAGRRAASRIAPQLP